MGSYPQWCLGNITECAKNGFSLRIWLHLLPERLLSSEDVILITNEGSGTNCNGFKIVRRFDDQFTITVAFEDKIWSLDFRLLTTDVTSEVIMKWSKSTGLSVGIDRLLWMFDVRPISRPRPDSACPQSIQIGLNSFRRPIASCNFGISDIKLVNSEIEMDRFNQKAGKRIY